MDAARFSNLTFPSSGAKLGKTPQKVIEGRLEQWQAANSQERDNSGFSLYKRDRIEFELNMKNLINSWYLVTFSDVLCTNRHVWGDH